MSLMPIGPVRWRSVSRLAGGDDPRTRLVEHAGTGPPIVSGDVLPERVPGARSFLVGDEVQHPAGHAEYEGACVLGIGSEVHRRAAVVEFDVGEPRDRQNRSHMI